MILLLFLLSFQINIGQDQVQALVSSLIGQIDPSLSQNSYFPEFAKEKIRWISDQQRQGKLDVVILTSIQGTDLNPDDLMGSAVINGKPTIVIAGLRFVRFVMEEQNRSEQMKNDFLIALVHETIHLDNPNLSKSGHLREEIRVNQLVDLKVIRKMLMHPMHQHFREIDAALTSCKDLLPCPRLEQVLKGRYGK